MPTKTVNHNHNHNPQLI